MVDTEPGCLYYGFSFDGDHAHCREGYSDALGAIADVVRFELHGPEAELAKLRGPFADLKPQYFSLEYGFRRKDFKWR